MYMSCHSGYEQPDMVHIHAIAVQSFPEAIIVSYALLLLRLWPLRRCFFAGMLTGQNNCRIIDAVIERFYRQGRIINIMGHVSPGLQKQTGGATWSKERCLQLPLLYWSSQTELRHPKNARSLFIITYVNSKLNGIFRASTMRVSSDIASWAMRRCLHERRGWTTFTLTNIWSSVQNRCWVTPCGEDGNTTRLCDIIITCMWLEHRIIVSWSRSQKENSPNMYLRQYAWALEWNRFAKSYCERDCISILP